MPITRKEFEEGNFTVLRGKAYLILEFLKSNKDKAYLSKEIAVAIKSSPVATTPILKKMTDTGLIEKHGPYYSVAKNDTKVIQEESKKKSKSEEPQVEEELEDEPYEGENAEPEPYVEPQQ